MPILPSELPGSLSVQPGSSGLFTRSGVAYNYAIGGLPWLSAASREHPIIRETAPIRKQQFDSQQIPGEQSLDGWWLRSQQSFHGGAGQLFGDPAEDNPLSAIRFLNSKNVDVWTPGRVRLLLTMGGTGIATGGVKDMTEFTYGDDTHAAFAVTATNFITVRGVLDATTTVFPHSTTLHTCTTDGSHIFVAAQDGVWSAPIPATSPGVWTWTKEYDIPANTKPVFMAFVKHRIILGVGPAVYELVPHPPTPPAALPTAKYTSPDTNWTWTGITESAAAIYVVGNNTVRGSILKFVLDNNGDIPTLTGGAIAAQLPSGEVPYSAMGYLGSFVGIGTNKGVRIGVADAQGNIEYGPILFETDGPVRAWTARDRFLWCGVPRGIDGESGLYRIDLSTQVGELRFPYAPDLTMATETTDVFAVAHAGSSDLKVAASATAISCENPFSLTSDGYLQTSRIRFSTLEPKLFKLLRVRGPVLAGSLSVGVLDQDDITVANLVFPDGEQLGTDDATISSVVGPEDFISLKFTLAKDSIELLEGGEFWAYQLKALPASPRQRMIQLPLWCFDYEADRHGARVGGEGTAFKRLRALENLERTGDSVTLQDFDIQENTQCVIERINFTQTSPPPHCAGWGGVVTVTLRTI